MTSLARTALDVAAREGEERVAQMLDRALLEGQYDHGEMLRLLRARRGSRGVRPLRAAVAGLGSEGVVFRSRPERVARDLMRTAGLPAPMVNAWFPTRAGHGYELDLWLADVRIDIEVDGPHHRQPHQRRRDALRDADLSSFGVLVVRIPDTVVVHDPGRFIRECRSALAQRGWIGTRRATLG